MNQATQTANETLVSIFAGRRINRLAEVMMKQSVSVYDCTAVPFIQDLLRIAA